MAIILKGRSRDLDGIQIKRILPQSQKRMVGPFIFIDHMGPTDFAAGEGIDVRPHPHIGLSTITYLFEGSLLHRDSLGNHLEILPGDVNWMTAGRGIVHSERETLEVKARPHHLDGMQCWVALPRELAEMEPGFTHIKRADLPHYMFDGVMMRLIAGEAFGLSSPVKTYSPMFYLDVLAKAGKTIRRPNPDQECLVYVVQGSLDINEQNYQQGDLILLEQESCLQARSNCRLLLLGGQEWPEIPHISWNFVSFSQERIDQAKQDWRAQRFACIPGDREEYVPLPE